MLFPMISSLFFLPTLCVCGQWRALPLSTAPHSTTTFPDNVHMEFSSKSPQKQWQNSSSSSWITTGPQAVAATQEDANAFVEMPGTCPIADKGFPGISSLSPREEKVLSPQPRTQSLSLCYILFVSKITLFVLDQLVLEALKLGAITRCYYSAGIKLYLASAQRAADRWGG